MQKLYLILGILIGALLPFFGLAQAPPVNQFVSVGLPTPDVASLGQFGDVPVSYETGVPNITIPVYEIKVGKISVPISLDYHAGGIKVNDISSSIGIGWALNCGGEISRNLVGLPDELPGGYLSAPASSDNYNVDDPSTYQNSIDYNFIFSVAGWGNGPRSEVQPDMFNYSIPGQGGRFMFNHDASAFQIPLTNNQIKFFFNANNSDNSYFIITNEEGLQFIFADQETNSVQPILRSDIPHYINTWKLSKIIDPNTADTVSFTYALVVGGTELARDDIWTDTWIPQASSEGNVTTEQPGGGITASYSFTQHTHEKFLQEIDWRGGKVSFVNQTGRSDEPTDPRVSEIDVYNSTGDQIKKAVLDNNHYFHTTAYNPSIDNTYFHNSWYDYRMLLQSVALFSTNDDNQSQVYSMQYDNTTMASRYSCAQDKWGYNNGQFSNSTLMAPQSILSGAGAAETFGSANRNENSASIKACSLQSITYPTGGKTVFGLEPGQYSDPNDQGNVTQGLTTCLAQLYLGNHINIPSATTSFTVPYGSHNFRYSFIISTNNYPINNATQYMISIVDVTSNSQPILFLYSTSAGNSINTGVSNYQAFNFNYISGHVYAIRCTANPQGNINNLDPSTNIVAEMTLAWDQYVYTPVTGGGLRVKSITNYDANGAFINGQNFQYSIGTLMTPASFLFGNQVNTQYGIFDELGDLYHATFASTAFYSNTVLPSTMMGGSPILYNDVIKYQTDANGNTTNGKTEYEYNIVQDNYIKNDYQLFYMSAAAKLFSNFWQNGQLAAELQYKSTGDVNNPYYLINSKYYTYSLDRPVAKAMMDIAPIYPLVGINHFPPAANAIVSGFFVLNSYQIPSGIMLLHQVVNTDIDNNGSELTTTENYNYNNSTYVSSLTQKNSTNSKGETITENYKYPFDLTATGLQYQKIVNENNIAPVVQYQKLNNNVQLLQRNVNYTDFNDPANTNPSDNPFLQPTSISEQVENYPADTRIMFNSYDRYGNITRQQKTNDMFQSYIWDYNSMYPVAKVEGASTNQVAYTSFESDEVNSNWIFDPAFISFNGGATGNNYYFLESGYSTIATKNTLQSSSQYIVSYWNAHTQPPLSITGTIGVPRQGPTINGWTYYEHTVTGVSSITISGNQFIDELRLYPKGALMTTSTYTPLVGISSQCDASDHITYYDYDGFNRLTTVLDQNRNIVKQYCYNYLGQQTSNCDPNASILLDGNQAQANWTVVLTNTETGNAYNFSVSNTQINGGISLGSVPKGIYNVVINNLGGSPFSSSFNVISFGSYIYSGNGNPVFDNITLSGSINLNLSSFSL